MFIRTQKTLWIREMPKTLLAIFPVTPACKPCYTALHLEPITRRSADRSI
jgi:hypothetical protein